MAACAALAGAFLTPRAASALPPFSIETGLSCEACHETANWREVNGLGALYVRMGYRLPNLGRHHQPIATLRARTTYRSEPDPTGLPKSTIDEIEGFLAARATRNLSIAVDSYIVDGARPGNLVQGWVRYTTTGPVGAAPVRITVGEQQLPLPIDVEPFRQTVAGVAAAEATVGASTFALNQSKNGIALGVGSPVRGLSATLLAASGHDPGSGVAATGTDRLAQAQAAVDGVVIGGFVLDGRRPAGSITGAFARRAVYVNVYRGHAALETLAVRGRDSSPNGDGVALRSSGGYAQFGWKFSPQLSLVARLDGTHDDAGGMTRALVAGVRYTTPAGLHLGAEVLTTHQPVTTHRLALTLGTGITTTRMGGAAY